MRLEILKENFKKGVNAAEKVTKKSGSLPILQNVLMRARGNFLELITTNLESSLKWWILSKIEEEGDILVPANFLSNLLNLIKSEKIKLQNDNKNLILIIENQNNRIQGQDVNEFPIIPKIEKKDFYQMPLPELIKGLQQVIDIPNPSQIRPEISGIYLSFKKDKLKIVGTDSFRLSEKTIKLNKIVSKESSFIISQEAGRGLINILEQNQDNIYIYPNPNQILFEILTEGISQPKMNFISRIIEGEYPNYQEIIPKKYKTEIKINKDFFQNQIKEAGLFSGKSAEVKIKTFPKENKVKIFSQSPESGMNESYLNCNINGEEMEVSFNYRFLIDGLQNIKSSEIFLNLSEKEGPALLKPVGDESYIYVLMPIKAF